MSAHIAEADSSSDNIVIGRDGERSNSPDSQSSPLIPVGQAVQIVTVDPETREFVLDEEALESILLSEKCKDRPVSVVSIAGDFRKGKSFLLNFLLRYLSSKGYENGDKWLMGDKDIPLKGFSWRGGSERDTTGILMWSEPFIVPLKKATPNGHKETAVLLMDTQGAFDSEYTVKDSATVFALSTMTSSVQVFNVLHNLQEDNLQVLQTFTEYGRLALEETDETPFQNLVFLIRDWSFAYEHGYGLEGGNHLLEKKLIVNEKQPQQLQRVRKHIRSCFESISCFLMPHPGKIVATNPKFDGRIADIDEDFLEHLQAFVPLLLSPRDLVIKKISGSAVSGRELLEYFRVYINVFKGETMPEPKSMLEATAEANNRAAVAMARDFYTTKMEEVCGGNKPYIHPKQLEGQHADLLVAALDLFEKTPKMGGREYSETYLSELRTCIQDTWAHFEAQNNSKNVFSLLGAPAVLLVWSLICFIIGRIFEFVGIMIVSNLFMSFGTFSLCFTIAYMFCRYGGTMPELVQAVDAIAERMYGVFLDIAFKTMQTAIEQRTGLQFPNANNTTTNAVNSSNSSSINHSPSILSNNPSVFPSASSARLGMHRRGPMTQ